MLPLERGRVLGRPPELPTRHMLLVPRTAHILPRQLHSGVLAVRRYQVLAKNGHRDREEAGAAPQFDRTTTPRLFCH